MANAVPPDDIGIHLSGQQLLRHLRGLERELHQPSVRSNPDRLAALLHESFLEYGKSGTRFTRGAMLELLAAEGDASPGWSEGHELAELTDGVALLTYRSARADETGALSEHALRSSLWVRSPRGWQVRFHQGTPTQVFRKRVSWIGPGAAAALAHPAPEFEFSYGTYLAELGDEERYPFPLDFEFNDFAALLQRLEDYAKGVNLAAGHVASSTFWLIDGVDILGVSNLRHELNDEIRHCGGHIGLSIRPSCRGRGLGNLLLALTIDEARSRGIATLHVHCHQGNAASAGMIIRNGGVLHSEVEESAEIVQRYLVALSP